MNLNQAVETFFGQKNLGDEFAGCGLFVFKQDGQIVSRYPDFKDDSSVGALMGGLWQAAMTLTQFMSEELKEEEFRLGFDTSTTGVLILPFVQKKYQLYLGMLYKDKTNPAQIKTRLRFLRDDLEEYVIKNASKEKKTKKNEYLFENITDDEIDRMFSTVGG